jgi:hypothetical protein
MNGSRSFKAWSLAALGATALVPVAIACGGSHPTTTNVGTTGSFATYPGGPPSTGPGMMTPCTPGATTTPPGYPGAPSVPCTPTGYASGGPSASAPQPSATASGPLAPTDPNSLQAILQGLSGALQGTLVNPGASADLTESGLKAHAARVAPGMQPEGDELKQTLTEGQHAVMMVTLQAGKCYAIVGYSAPGGVKDLDLNLLAPPLYMTLAGQDLSHNNTPTIGAAPSPMCPVIAFPLQYKLDVYAKSGSGAVAVQLYSKNK